MVYLACFEVYFGHMFLGFVIELSRINGGHFSCMYTLYIQRNSEVSFIDKIYRVLCTHWHWERLLIPLLQTNESIIMLVYIFTEGKTTC